MEAKVALQGNRITLKAKQDLNDKSIKESDFQLFNKQGEKLKIDKISIEKNEIEIFPKERILRDSGEKFTINYLGKNPILKEQFSNKSFENTSQAKPLSISDLRLDKEGLLYSTAGFLNLIDLKKDNTIYYTTNPKYVEKLTFGNKIRDFFVKITDGSIEPKNYFDLEKQQKQSVISAMDYISKATNINFVYTDDIEKANIGFANSTILPEDIGARCASFKYVDGELVNNISQTSTEKFTSFEQKNLISLRAPTPEITYEPGSFYYESILHEVGHALGLNDVSLNPKLKKLTTADTLMSYIHLNSEKFYTKYNNLDLISFKLLYGKDGLNHKDGLSYDKTMQTLSSQIQMSKQILKSAALVNKEEINEIQLVYDKLAEDKNNLPKPDYTFQKKLFEKFNELQKTFDSMIVFDENKLKNELKDYSIGELKNISYLKQFKLNEINDFKELNKKINEINKDLQNNTTLQEISNLNRFNKISTDKQLLNSQLLNSNNNDKSISQIQEKLQQKFNKLTELNKKTTISQNKPTPF